MIAHHAHSTHDRTTASLDLYLKDIQGDALLSAAEERLLAEAIRRGDRDAKDRMIRANLRLVVKIARDYIGRGLTFDDLVGEGNLGLIRATEEYDPSFGTRFSTYAAHWIKQAIRHALITTGTTIRLPAHVIGLLTKWRRAERILRRQFDAEPTFEEVADYLGLTPAQRVLVQRAQQSGRFCQEGCHADDDETPWTAAETVAPPEAPGAALEAAEEQVELLRRLNRLDDRERTILALRYGLGGGEPLTLKEVGRRLGVTREWVRKIEQRAVRKLDENPDDPNSSTALAVARIKLRVRNSPSSSRPTRSRPRVRSMGMMQEV